ANAGTLLHRVGKWSTLSQVRGEHVCGDEAREMLGRAKIKMYVTCTDSLTANLSVAGMEQMEVVEVPLSAKVDQNRAVLNLCSSDLQNSDGQELILSMLNNDWGCPLNNGSLLHFCKPNCCKTKEDFQFKMRQALE
ncbi:unnamed protein product, partial [Durusdinium trenchii]